MIEAYDYCFFLIVYQDFKTKKPVCFKCFIAYALSKKIIFIIHILCQNT